MSDIFPKFIIEKDDELGDCLIIIKVSYHRDIANDKTKVKGGGWYFYEARKFTFYGDSDEFGRCNINDIKKCIENDKVFTTNMLVESIAKCHKFFYKDNCNTIYPLN